MPRPTRLNREDITPDVLKTFQGFENLTQEEAEMLCNFTIKLCSLAYEAHMDHKKEQEDERFNAQISKIRKEGD
jgi:hypothetical protein